MNSIRVPDELLQSRSSESSEEISKDVGYDYDRCSELNAQFLSEADKQHHRHGKHRQEQLVLQTGQSAAKCNDRMQNGEGVNDI